MTDHGRLDIFRAWLPGMRSLLSLERALDGSGLQARLLELVRLRTSQLNRCGFCVDMHVSAVTRAGDDLHRLSRLSTWRDSPSFAGRERAALALAEEITECRTGVSDTTIEAAREHFSPPELAQLTYAAAATNAWNRLAVADRTPPAAHHPQPDRTSDA